MSLRLIAFENILEKVLIKKAKDLSAWMRTSEFSKHFLRVAKRQFRILIATGFVYLLNGKFCVDT